VATFILTEKEAFSGFKMAGGDLSDQTRIADVKARFSDKMLTAYESFLESQACLAKREPMLEKRWGKFCKVMERVGKAIKPTGAPAAHTPRQPG